VPSDDDTSALRIDLEPQAELVAAPVENEGRADRQRLTAV